MQKESVVNNMLLTVWSTPAIYKYAFLCNDILGEALVRSFQATRDCFCKLNLVKMHCIEIRFEPDDSELIANNVVQFIGQIFYSDFPMYVVLYPNPLRALFLINSLSIHGQSFHDNNTTYRELIGALNERFGMVIEFEAAESTMYRNLGMSNFNFVSYQ